MTDGKVRKCDDLFTLSCDADTSKRKTGKPPGLFCFTLDGSYIGKFCLERYKEARKKYHDVNSLLERSVALSNAHISISY
jgi:hypothetical protein